MENRIVFSPFRFARLPGIDGRVLLTNAVGEYLFLSNDAFEQFVQGQLPPSNSVYEDLAARHFLQEAGLETPLRLLAAKYRSLKQPLFQPA